MSSARFMHMAIYVGKNPSLDECAPARDSFLGRRIDRLASIMYIFTTFKTNELDSLVTEDGGAFDRWLDHASKLLMNLRDSESRYYNTLVVPGLPLTCFVRAYVDPMYDSLIDKEPETAAEWRQNLTYIMSLPKFYTAEFAIDTKLVQ